MNIRSLAVCAAFMLAPVLGWAQDFDFQAVMAAGTTATLSFDAGYEQSKGSQIPLYFTIQVPIADGLMQAKSITTKPGHYTDLTFLTPGGALVEKLELRQATMGLGSEEERMQWVADMIQNEAFPMLTESIEGIRLLEVRKSHAGPYSAVELIAVYTHETLGEVGFRIMGIFPPAGENLLFGISHTLIQHIPLDNYDDFAATMAGTTLNSLHFSAARGPDGGLSSF